VSAEPRRVFGKTIRRSLNLFESRKGDSSMCNSLESEIAVTDPMGHRVRFWVVTAVLAALFLGALDALVMSAAMPSIIAELKGLELYGWVYSAYFLARAVCLPIFGKLSDLFDIRRLFLIAITIFLTSSLLAGFAPDMETLIAGRIFQGIGAAGIFALVYIVLADIAPPGKRAKLLSLASSIWGIASVLGPTLGGFIVTYFSWRWIFFINVPISLFSMILIARFLVEVREKKRSDSLDIAGAATLSVSILSLLMVVMVGGRNTTGLPIDTVFMMGITVVFVIAFYFIEKRAKDPILPLAFFKIRAFSIGNACVFLSSFAIFSLFAYAPLYIQGAQGRTPMEVGLAMIALSLGWSIGSFVLGQYLGGLTYKTASVLGAVFLISGSVLTLTFSQAATMMTCFWVFLLVGLGMGFVTLATLLTVQSSVDASDLGVATSSHQFSRTLGGSIGVGVSGGIVTARLSRAMEKLDLSDHFPNSTADLATDFSRNVEHLFRQEVQAGLPLDLRITLQQAVGESVDGVFCSVLVVSILCLICCLIIPPDDRSTK